MCPRPNSPDLGSQLLELIRGLWRVCAWARAVCAHRGGGGEEEGHLYDLISPVVVPRLHADGQQRRIDRCGISPQVCLGDGPQAKQC